MECPAWFFVQSASEKMGHLNSLLHPPLAINPSTFFHPYLLLVCLPHSFFFSLFVPPPRGRAQSDKVTDGHFSCHFFLPFLSDRVCDCVTPGSLIDRGRGGVCVFRRGWGVEGLGWCKNDGVCLSGCFVGWWWCAWVWGGVRQGGALIGWESWGEEVWGSREEGWGCLVWRRSSVHSSSHTRCDSLEVSHLAAPRCLSARLYWFPMWKCALTVLAVLLWPLGITAVRTRAKTDTDSWAWVCRHEARGTSEELPLVPMLASGFVCCVFYFLCIFINSVKYCDRVKRN